MYTNDFIREWSKNGEFLWIFEPGEDQDLTVPVSDEEEDQLPEDPDARRTSILAEEAANSAGLSKRRTGEKEADIPAKRLRGVEN